MYLKQLIEYLEKQPPDTVVPLGFASPHSYRGYYEYLAFEPVRNVTAGEMLASAKEAFGTTYTGWKGGNFTMDKYTDVYIAQYGDTGEEIGHVLLDYMFGVYEKDRVCETG